MTTTANKTIEWYQYDQPPVCSKYITMRPLSIGVGQPPEEDEYGDKLILPTLTINSITVLMPKLDHPNTNWRATDLTQNSAVESLQIMSYIRSYLNGTTDEMFHEEKEDHIRIWTTSEEIIKLWCLHHKGEFVGEASATYGTLPVKMEVDINDILMSYEQDYGRRLDEENKAIAYDYGNEWNYVVSSNRTIRPIDPDRQTTRYQWINNFQASRLSADIAASDNDF